MQSYLKFLTNVSSDVMLRQVINSICIGGLEQLYKIT